MANTSSRTLRLLSLLQSRRYWPGPELAARLDVSARTLRRDVERLRELGYPVQGHRGAEGGYQLAAGASLPPLVLDDDEAVSLAVGMMAAARSSVIGIEDASVRAMAKVMQVLPARLRRRVDALQSMTEPMTWGAQPASPVVVNAQLLTAVAQSCRDAERMRFAYTARAGEQSQRHVEPHRLVFEGRRWYMVGYDLDRHDWRSFRLDRMDAVERTGARFAQRPLPADDAAAFVRASLNWVATRHAVTAVALLPAGEATARIGRWSAVEPIDARSCRLRMEVDDLEWAALALGTLGAPFTVEGPPELRELLAAWGARFAAAASG
jgi:predicted DNA-binding transcriptional regulator YafY